LSGFARLVYFIFLALQSIYAQHTESIEITQFNGIC
jgi:hypothetical protein